MMTTKLRLAFFVSLVSFLILSCGLPATLFNPETADKPGSAVLSQVILDCNTGSLLHLGTPIQPLPGCDSWQINRYERPFNARMQDRYFADLDILSASLGKSQHWYYVRLEIFDVSPASGSLEGIYGLEIDLDLDGRGDVLITTQLQDLEDLSAWSNVHVQAWKDPDNDVGSELPMRPDPAVDTSGYDDPSLDPQALSDEVWVRAELGRPSFVEIAFKPEVLEGDDAFKWWAWVDKGVANPAGYDYHDFFSREQAGDVYTFQPFFPSRAVFSVDNTCAAVWGMDPPPDDPSLCIHDPLISRTPLWTETPPDCGFDLCSCDGRPTFTPTAEDTPTRVTLTPTQTPTPRSTETPTYTPTETSTPTPTETPTRYYVPPTRTPTQCIPNPAGGGC
jgi:hypothetical protein